ncbi:discoidin domain-containing protein [Paenibacillus lautus]|uniref:discoidin domain-containing protein n=1 Tax=Paenibacillus lautus TaxID=1401 RepID=UPI003D2B07FC
MAYLSNENAIPQMTSNTMPSGVVSASSVYSKDNEWIAFNNSSSEWRTANGNVDGWIRYDFPRKICIGKYSIRPGSTLTANPKMWLFEGSNDGINWTVLDNKANQTSWASSANYTIPNKVSYSKYRLNIGQNNGYANFTSLRQVVMYEYVYENKFLISPENGAFFSLKNAKYTSNLMPTMTSNTAPSGEVTASSYFSGYEPFRISDGSDTYTWQSSNYAFPQWVGYEFTEKQKINRYSLTPGFTERMPVDWTFEGWDGSTWVILDSRTGIRDWTRGVTRYFEFKNHEHYIKYRIHITANNGVGIYTSIAEMTMERLIPADLLELPNDEQSFINHGAKKDEVVDLNEQINKRTFVEDGAATLGAGKVFKRVIDTSKIPIKKLSIT